MAAVAGDVPDRYDVVINGVGYMFAYSEQIKGESSYTPIVANRRQDRQSELAGSEFDFWTTFSQTDWSLGTGQRFINTEDPDEARRFWTSDSVDVSRPGEITLAPSQVAQNSAADVRGSWNSTNALYFITGTGGSLYSINKAQTITSQGAHGLTFPTGSEGAIFVEEGGHTFVSALNATEGTRYNPALGTTFAQWSTTSAHSLVGHNNLLYGINDGDFFSFAPGTGSPAGDPITTIHQWKSVDGAANEMELNGQLISFGGSVFILLYDSGVAPNGRGGEIWEYDGVGVARVAQFPYSFIPWRMQNHLGALFIGGYFQRSNSGTEEYRPSVFVWVGGSLSLLWQEDEWTTVQTAPAPTPWGEHVYWDSIGILHRYNPQTGAVEQLSVLSGQVTPDRMSMMAASYFHLASLINEDSTHGLWPDDSVVTTGNLDTSLFDGESALDKHWEDVIVDFDDADDGDGGSVDISYVLDDLDAAYTSLQTGAVSGTAYALNVSSQAIGVSITLNKGTSTDGPRVKRLRVRGSLIHPQYRLERYVLNLGGVDGTQPVKRRDGTVETQDGLELAQDLRTAFTSGDDFSVTDEFGTFNAVFDTNGLRIMRTAAEEYVAIVELRES